MAVKNFCSRWISQLLKKGSCWLVHRNVGDASKDVYRIVTDDKSWISTQTNSPPCGPSKTSQMQRKLFVEKALRSKWSAVSSAKLVMYQLFHLSNVVRSNLSNTPQFHWRNSKNQLKKTNHCSQWQCEFSHIGSNQRRGQRWWVNRRTALTCQWQPMTSFIFAHQENTAWSTIIAKHQFLLN